MGHAPDGRVVFVPFTAPGDRARVQVESETPHFLRAHLVELLTPGPARVAPPCAVFGRCGGCAWQHLAYPAQVEAKRAIVLDALVRIGRVKPPDDVRFVPSPAPYGYRGRARVFVERGRVGFRRLRSHALCPVERCPVLLPPVDAALADLARRPPGDDGEWELAAGEDGVGQATPIGDIRRRERGSRARVARARTAAPVVLRVGPDRLAVTPGVFAQANALLFEALAAEVVGAAGRGDLALELFAGAGFFTLGLARGFARGVAVESDRDAARDLTANLQAAGHAHVEVRREPAAATLARWRGAPPDVVVLDPPRGGVGGEAARALAGLGAPRVVHVSCDPATLARDAAVLVEAGYTMRRLVGFDLFPQTAHVEAVLTLEKG